MVCMKTETRQCEFGFTNWGGRRRGAGRKPKGERAGVSHGKRPKLCARHPVLVTMRLREGLPSLRYDDAHELVRRVLVSSSEREGFRVIEYSVQSNHLHLLVEASDERALSRGMNGLASSLARGLNRIWRRSGRVFSDRYHARRLETPREVRVALVYVLQNGRKHGAWKARGSVLDGRGLRGLEGRRRGCANKCARSSLRADVAALGRMAEARVDRAARSARARKDVDEQSEANPAGEVPRGVGPACGIGRSPLDAA